MSHFVPLRVSARNLWKHIPNSDYICQFEARGAPYSLWILAPSPSQYASCPRARATTTISFARSLVFGESTLPPPSLRLRVKRLPPTHSPLLCPLSLGKLGGKREEGGRAAEHPFISLSPTASPSLSSIGWSSLFSSDRALRARVPHPVVRQVVRQVIYNQICMYTGYRILWLSPFDNYWILSLFSHVPILNALPTLSLWLLSRGSQTMISDN